MIAKALVVTLALTMAGAPSQPVGSGYQLACSEMVGGVVTSQSTGYRLLASLPYSVNRNAYSSDGRRLFTGCLAGFYDRELFDRLFEDRFQGL